MSRVHVPDLEKSLWLFCRISVSAPGQHLGMSGVGFPDELGTFSARPPLIALALLPT